MRCGLLFVFWPLVNISIIIIIIIFFTLLCADKLYKVDGDKHVTEGISDADEGYQMKDVGGKSVCLSVCLSVCSYISKTTLPYFTKFYVHFIRCRQCVLNVLPILWMTSRFYAYFSSSSPGGGTSRTSENRVWSRSQGGGTEGEVCRLRLHLAVVVVLNWCWSAE